MKPPELVGKKNETDDTRQPRAVSFIFFPTNSGQFYRETFFFFCGQFHVKLGETGGIFSVIFAQK